MVSGVDCFYDEKNSSCPVGYYEWSYDILTKTVTYTMLDKPATVNVKQSNYLYELDQVIISNEFDSSPCSLSYKMEDVKNSADTRLTVLFQHAVLQQ